MVSADPQNGSAHKHKALTLTHSQHQLHRFGPAHSSFSVFQALEEACGSG